MLPILFKFHNKIQGIELDPSIRERLAYILHQNNNPDAGVQQEIVTALNELQQMDDYFLYTLDAITNSELDLGSRMNATILMRHGIGHLEVSPPVIKIIKSQVEQSLIPILTLSNESSDQVTNSFCCLTAALIAEIARNYGSNTTFSNGASFVETIVKLLSTDNPPQSIMSALSLIEEFLVAHLEVPPDFILLFPPLLQTDDESLSDIFRQIFDICILYCDNNLAQAIKEAIIPLFLSNLETFPADLFVKLINLVGSTIINIELEEPDEVDQGMIAFIIQCIGDADPFKQVSAMHYFEQLQGKIGFIPEAVSLLYSILPNDDGDEESEVVRNCQSALTTIAENHQEEMIPLVAESIKQDLEAYSAAVSQGAQTAEANAALKRGLRGITTIEKFIPDVNDIFTSITSLLETPMRNEAILAIENLGLDHPDLYEKILPLVLPFVAFAQSEDLSDSESSYVRMQAMRTVTNFFKQYDTPIPFQPFIEPISRMLDIAIKLDSVGQQDELINALAVISLFIYNSQSFSAEEINPILTYTMENFINRSEDDYLSLDFLTILTSIVPKIISVIPTQNESQQAQLIQFVLSIFQAIHPKCLEYLNSANDNQACYKILYLFDNLYSLIKDQCAGSFAQNIIDAIVPIFPKLAEFFASDDNYISNQAWEFASDIIRSAPELFQDLLQPAIHTVLALDDDSRSTGILGNMALALYDIFKLNIGDISSSLSEENFEHLIDIFSYPLERDLSEMAEIDNELDIINISFLVLRLCAMTKLPIPISSYQNAVQIVQTLDPSLATLIEEVKQLIAEIERAQCVKPNDADE